MSGIPTSGSILRRLRMIGFRFGPRVCGMVVSSRVVQGWVLSSEIGLTGGPCGKTTRSERLRPTLSKSAKDGAPERLWNIGMWTK